MRKVNLKNIGLIYLKIISDGTVLKKIDITVKENIKKANLWDLYKRNLNRVLVGK